MRTLNRAIGVASLASLLFLLSTCAKPEPPKGTTGAPIQAANQPEPAQPPAVTPSPPGSAGPGATEPQAEEYAVYDAAINNLYLSILARLGGARAGTLFIVDTTTTEQPLDHNALAHTRQVLGVEPSRDLIDYYNAKNKEGHRLERRFRISGEYLLVSQRQLDTVVQTGQWQGKRVRSPVSRATVELSRVGFNSRADEAIVYVGNAYVGVGRGQLVLLQKARGRWTVRSLVGLWIACDG